MLESNIHAVSEQFSRIYQVPESGINEQKKMFIISYKNGYIDSGSKLFTAFMQDHRVLSQGLLRPAMKYTRNDRGKMRAFMLGILKLLLMAARVELAYLGGCWQRFDCSILHPTMADSNRAGSRKNEGNRFGNEKCLLFSVIKRY